MERAVQELKILMREMILEIGELKEKVARLEKMANNEPEIIHRSAADSLKLQGEGYDNLAGIYKQGYHICPMAYGELRTGECLFCIAFIEKE